MMNILEIRKEGILDRLGIKKEGRLGIRVIKI
jgi:hypothetical protein